MNQQNNPRQNRKHQQKQHIKKEHTRLNTKYYQEKQKFNSSALSSTTAIKLHRDHPSGKAIESFTVTDIDTEKNYKSKSNEMVISSEESCKQMTNASSQPEYRKQPHQSFSTKKSSLQQYKSFSSSNSASSASSRRHRSGHNQYTNNRQKGRGRNSHHRRSKNQSSNKCNQKQSSFYDSRSGSYHEDTRSVTSNNSCNTITNTTGTGTYGHHSNNQRSSVPPSPSSPKSYCSTGTCTSSIASNSLYSHDQYSIGNYSVNASSFGGMASSIGPSVPSLTAASTYSSSMNYGDQVTVTTGGSSILPPMISITNSQHQQKVAGSDANKREWLLRMNEKLSKMPIGQMDPVIIPIKAMMCSWTKLKNSKNTGEEAQMVEMLLNRIVEEWNIDKSRRLKGNGTPGLPEPTVKLYTMAVDTWAKSGVKGAAVHAERILQTLHQSILEGGHGKVSTGIFNAVLNAHARTSSSDKSYDEGAAIRAEQILHWMTKLCNDGNEDVKPDRYTYNTCIHAYAKCGNAEKALSLLNSMRNSESNSGNTSICKVPSPDTISYNVTINALAKSNIGNNGSDLAEQLLKEMHTLYNAGNPHVKPNVVTYGAVIDAHAKSGSMNSAKRADHLLAQLIELHQSDPNGIHADCKPNTYVFNTVCNAWSKCTMLGDATAAYKAEEILFAMETLSAQGLEDIKPDVFTYTACIDAWSRSGHANRAKALLEKMITDSACAASASKPNSYTYNAVIHALAKNKDPIGAEKVLRKMIENKSSNKVTPSTINFNTVIDAYAKTSRPQDAERVLLWMDELSSAMKNEKDAAAVQPDIISFNAVIDAWARVAHSDQTAVQRAVQILEHMGHIVNMQEKEQHNVKEFKKKKGKMRINLKPDLYTYNTIINAHAKSLTLCTAEDTSKTQAVIQRANGILHRMRQNNLNPNVRTYTCLMDVYAKSRLPHAPLMAEELLYSMQKNCGDAGGAVKPNTHTYNALFNACAFTKGNSHDKSIALDIAMRNYNTMLQLGNHQDEYQQHSDHRDHNIKPDTYTFTIMLSVVANCIPWDDLLRRHDSCQSLFEQCCNAGCVNDFVFKKLSQALLLKHNVNDDDSILLSITGGVKNLREAPYHWKRNANKNHTKQRKGKHTHSFQKK